MHYKVRDDGMSPSFAGLDEVKFENTLEAALEYHRRGFQVTPLAGKQPTLEGWPKRELAEDELPRHFFEGRNVGIVLGGDTGLVDVDLDNPLATEVAEHILPDTLKSGREKNPCSHYWYLIDPTPTSRSYSLPGPMAKRLGVDHGDATLAELRSTGRQTMVAPSRHPDDGDEYRWHRGVIRVIDGEELERLVEDVAVATLLALNWPLRGARQTFALHAAGYLGRHVEHGRVEAILQAAAAVAEDEEIDKRSQAVRDTLAKLEKLDK
ncbi:MAG TPA: bifunctional DNA primase/polymerase [Rubrobacteraceae bacterium]|nr:bifunctional DNA primase/polymerase [Rubrobacteraceae bacterium]